VKSPCIKLNSCSQHTLGLRLSVYAFFRNIIGFCRAFISQKYMLKLNVNILLTKIYFFSFTLVPGQDAQPFVVKGFELGR